MLPTFFRQEIVISVIDEVNDRHKKFICQQDVLVDRMGYFRYFLKNILTLKYKQMKIDGANTLHNFHFSVLSCFQGGLSKRLPRRGGHLCALWHYDLWLAHALCLNWEKGFYKFERGKFLKIFLVCVWTVSPFLLIPVFWRCLNRPILLSWTMAILFQSLSLLPSSR